MDGIYNTLRMDEITDQFDPGEMESQKALSIIVYIFSFLFFLPIVSNKESDYAKAVANQTLTLFIIEIIEGIVTRILGFIPVLGGLLSLVISLAVFALFVTKIIDAANGKFRKFPFGIEVPAFK